MERLTMRNEMGIAVLKEPYDCERCGEPAYRLHDCGNGEPVSRLAAYEETGLSPEQIKADKWKYDGSREEAHVSDETLYMAVNTQVEFLRRYRERYKDEPVFDNVILRIMMELKERRDAEGKKQVLSEEQGRLRKLPCEVGDTLFVIPTKENSLLKIAKMECIGFCIGKPNNTINLFPISRSEAPVQLYQPDFADFGKTVFPTCQEAENILEQMKKKEG